MATWSDMSREARSAAFELVEGGRVRSALSRAYYALFSALTGRLVAEGVQMPVDQEGPSHRKLCDGNLIANNLKGLDPRTRGRLISIVPNLYRLRIIADYRPSMSVTPDDVRLALGDMTQALQILEDAA